MMIPFHRRGKLRWRQRPTQQHTACRWLTDFPVQFSLLQFAFDAVPVWTNQEAQVSPRKRDLWGGQADWQQHGGLRDWHLQWRKSDRRDRHHATSFELLAVLQSVVSNFFFAWPCDCSPPRLTLIWDFSGKNTWKGLLFPSPGALPTRIKPTS